MCITHYLADDCLTDDHYLADHPRCGSIYYPSEGKTKDVRLGKEEKNIYGGYSSAVEPHFVVVVVTGSNPVNRP